jgi:hypothetical protein
MPESKNPQIYDPRPKLRGIIEALRLPAGPDPRFADRDAINAHRDDFIVRVHTTWKLIHTAAIEEIIHIEMLLARPDIAAMPRDSHPGFAICAGSGAVSATQSPGASWASHCTFGVSARTVRVRHLSSPIQPPSRPSWTTSTETRCRLLSGTMPRPALM